jgi:hypothetical protein
VSASPYRVRASRGNAYPDIKVEIVIDYGLTDIVTEQVEARAMALVGRSLLCPFAWHGNSIRRSIC